MKFLAIFVLMCEALSWVNGLGFHRELGLTVPGTKETFPYNVTTDHYALILPSFENVIKTIERNLRVLETIMNGTIYSAAENLYPLTDLKTSILYSIKSIRLNNENFAELLKPSRIGNDITVEDSYLIDTNKIFNELKFKVVSNAISTLMKLKEGPILEGSGAENSSETFDSELFRLSPQFDESLQLTISTDRTLKYFLNKYRSFLRTLTALKGGEMQTLSEHFFFQELVEEQINSSYSLINVRQYYRTDTKLNIILELAVYEQFVEYISHSNVQYYGLKLKNQYYSKSEGEEYFELYCLIDKICVPIKSECTKSMYNGTLYNVFTHCEFEESSEEYTIVPGKGLIINYEPENPDIINLLKFHDFHPLSYPAFIMFSGSLSLNNERISLKFANERSIIYSRHQDTIFGILNPKLGAKIMKNFGNTALVMFVSFSIIMFTTIRLGIWNTGVFIKNRYFPSPGKHEASSLDSKTTANLSLEPSAPPKKDKPKKRDSPPPKRESHSPKHRRDEREREGKERRDNREYRAHADPRELRPLNRAPRD